MQMEPNDHHDGIFQSAGPSPPATDRSARQLDADRIEALRLIDEAPFSWYRFKLALIAVIGFFTDAYDVFAINQASFMLGHVYGHTIGRAHFRESLFKWLGWKRMYGIELIVIITATFAQALAGAGPVVGVVALYRFIRGVGIEGGHPPSAVITSGFASRHIRGRLMMTAFTSQGWGFFAASVIALVVLGAYKDSIIADSIENPNHVDHCWRILVGLSCIPGTLALYFRYTVPETPRFTMDIDRAVQGAKDDIDNVLNEGANLGHWIINNNPDTVVQRVQVLRPLGGQRDFIQHFGQWRNFWLLFGVAYSWFAVEVVFYGLALNSSRLLSSPHLARAGFGVEISQSELSSSLGIYKWLRNVAVGSLAVSVAGLLPGYYATNTLIDRWGRKQLQFLGFSMLTILLVILAGIYPGDNPGPHLQNKAGAFVALYWLANFFAIFGSNLIAFILPEELFPTRYRSILHGIFAASGKLGAIVSRIIFFEVQGTNTILGIFAVITFAGMASTLLLEETMDQSQGVLPFEPQPEHDQGVVEVEQRDGIIHRRGFPQHDGNP